MLGTLTFADTLDPLDEQGELGDVFEPGPFVRVDPAKDYVSVSVREDLSVGSVRKCKEVYGERQAGV